MADNTVDLYNPHDGLTGRDGGPYLDQEERRLAEIRRAAAEGREPDFENTPASAGTPLVTAGELTRMANPASNPSMQEVNATDVGVKAIADDKDQLMEKFSERVDVHEDLPDLTNPADNPASLVYQSQDPDNVDAQTRETTVPDEEFDEDADDDEILASLTESDNNK